MKFAPHVFRAYDIRGIVPDELDADAAEQVGRAFAAHLNPQTVVVGRDVRLTGEELQGRAMEGLVRSGVDVINIGQVSTDAFYYACATRSLPGIMVTASHNPAEYNGFKLVKDMPFLVMAKEFKKHVLEETYKDAPAAGEIHTEPVVDDFIEHLLTIVPAENLRPLKVVIDTSSGAQGPIWERLADKLPISIIPLFFEPDGTFPGHGNDVIQPANQEPLRKKVIETKADLGLIFDPDGDRCLLVDDRGETVPGDFVTALLAAEMLKHHPGGTVLYDIRASDAVPAIIEQAGGKAFVWKPGHVYIKQKMKELGAVFGGEVSGHYYFRDFWGADCGLLAGLTILEYVSQLKGRLSEKVEELESTYHLSGEINSSVPDIPAAIARIRERYHDAAMNELSGLEIRYPDWRCVVRPSDNEPLIRLTLEADSQEKMEQKRDEVLALIRKEA
ncbi:MAG TPA: phosphomannomutase/phosphoglucomutase [Candidatus Polarisedimenticolaceae bacterium]|nr:phosphomannomutase/phosphoglucomutase [Candidatus Polarisedimenticolaceae bacterium]